MSSCQVVKFDPWGMLNNFCYDVYAQKSMFIGENGNGFLGTTAAAPALIYLRIDVTEFFFYLIYFPDF